MRTNILKSLFGEVVGFARFARKSVLAAEHMNVRQSMARCVVHKFSAYTLNWMQKSLKSNLATNFMIVRLSLSHVYGHFYLTC